MNENECKLEPTRTVNTIYKVYYGLQRCKLNCKTELYIRRNLFYLSVHTSI